MKDSKFPIFKFANSNVEYHIITNDNKSSLAKYMQENDLKKLIITSNEDSYGWNNRELPDLRDFVFLEELLIYWTNIKNISGIHSCKNLKVLWLDNDDTTSIEFSNFPYLEKFISWERKNIKNIWNVSTIKELTLAGVRKNNFAYGRAFDSIERLRLLKTSLTDISFLTQSKTISFLELLDFSKIEDLSPLKTLVQLKHLRISANKVSDFSFLKYLVNLEKLYISSKIGEFTKDYFSGLNKLQRVNLSGNVAIQKFNRELQARYL